MRRNDSWNKMAKSQLSDLKICLPSIIFQVVNSGDVLRKTISLTSF